VAIQSDGKIIVAGSASNRFAFARYNTDGSLDVAFGNGGKVITAFGNSSGANAIAIQSDGRLIAAGAADGDFALGRYNSDGSLDTSFGGGGKAITDFGGADSAHALAIQSDTKIVAAGTGNSDFALARYQADSDSFDLCIHDDGSSNLLQLNSTTGDYHFTNCSGFTIDGTGALIKRGGIIKLEHNAGNRRVLAMIDMSVQRATASIQVFSPAMTFTIIDRNAANNTCACP